MPIRYETRGRAHALHIANGPVNALSIANGHVAALLASVEEAIADPDCDTLILAGEGRMFCGGADIADFDRDTSELAQLRGLLNLIEASPKPVIMALHGMALGGGLELALAGHLRMATRETKLGLPEVTLGLLPGAGGTQRLPRLVGAAAAIEMMLSGKPITAEAALEAGLIDTIGEGDIVDAAFERAALGDVPLRRTAALPVPTDVAEAFEAARAKLRQTALDRAPQRILECVAAVSNDVALGLDIEARHFDRLVRSTASRGLRHAFRGERAVSRIPGLPKEVRPRTIATIGIVGGGTMGTGIAIAFLNAGFKVIMVEMRADALERAAHIIAKTIGRDAEKGRISRDGADERIAAFAPASSLDALATIDLVVEAVFEEISLKGEVFRALDRICRSDAILASNTSTLDLDAIAAFVEDPSRVVGLHFFSPANIMRLLEVVRGARTAPDVLATAIDLARRMGKVGVVSGVCDGFIGNRIFEEYLRQAWLLIEEGAMPGQVDAALEAWGMAMGPCRTMDLVGQDIGWAIRKRRKIEQPHRPYSGFIDRICEMGRFGQKTGKGIYSYADGRTPVADPEINALIVAYSKEIGVERRTITDREIVERCLLAMINEGARVVGEGIAYRPLDVDMTFLNGYGFPRERGGPMLQGDEIGLSVVLERLCNYATGRQGWALEPAPLIIELAQRLATFASLNTN